MTEMTATRLKNIRESAGLSIRKMADRLGMAPSTYGHYENPGRFKDQFLPMEFAKSVADALRSEGKSAEVMALAGVHEDTDPTPARIENGHLAPNGDPLVPVYDIAASAGDGSLVDYEGIAYSLAFPNDYIRRVTRTNPKNLTIISVKGDSMVPTLYDDDIVMLDMSKTSLGYEGLFVIRIFDVLHVKRLSHSRPGHVLVISDNRDNYPPREYPMSEIEVVGKVIWKGGKV